jgi:hypothetical protein
MVNKGGWCHTTPKFTANYFSIISTFVNLYRLVGMLVVSMGVAIDTSAFAFVMTSLLRKRKKQRNNSSSFIQPSIIHPKTNFIEIHLYNKNNCAI